MNSCDQFRAATSYVAKWIASQDGVGEESINDWLLFNLSEKAGAIQQHFLEFRKQWENYSSKVEALGRDLRLAQDKYDEIIGVRERQLMKPVDNILTTNVETLED